MSSLTLQYFPLKINTPVMETYRVTLRFPLGQDQIVFEEAPSKRGAGAPYMEPPKSPL